MSADRPPSQDNIGGHGTSTTTIINSTTTTSTTTNMVLSAIPLDSGHVVIQQSATASRITTLTNSPSTHQHHHQQLQQHIQQQQNGSNSVIANNFGHQIHRNNTSPSKIITTTSGHHSVGHHSITKIIGTSNGNGSGGGGGGGGVSGGGGTITAPSKYVIFQPNGHYTTNDAFIGQSNGVGNIVIVATDPMDISHPEHQQLQHHQQITAATGTTIINTNSNGGIGTTDEELTSLTWLTDKNLIKGLVACANKTTGTAQGLSNSPGRQLNCINSNNHVGSSNGTITPLSPTSDFMEDSSVSDENLSSANSSTTDQGICVRQNTINEYPAAIHLHKSQIQQHHIQYTNNNKNINNSNNNNNTISKNRNNIISPINNTNNSVNFTNNTSSKNNLIQQLQDHQSHLNGNLATALGATTTVHVGPSGTTTVVEYKSSNQNYLQSSATPTTVRHISNQQLVPHSTTITSSPSNLSSSISPIITQQQQPINKTLNNSFNPIIITSSTIPKTSQILSTSTVSSSVPLVVSAITTTPTPTTSTTTHHPHKKYLREQMNGFDHQQQQNSTNNVNINNFSTTNGQYSSSIPSSNIIPYIGNGNTGNSTTPTKINNQSMLTISESPPREYHQQQHSTPNKYAEYDNDSLKDYEIPNGTLSSSSSSNGRISSSAQKQHNASSGSLSPSKQKHPTNMPYDPYVHTNSKPPYSFSSLIFMAIEDSPEKALPVKEIYAWIVHHFPYFKTAPTGWKNSVRHNLSLNKSFLKVEKAPNMGKGSLWRVEQLQRPNLIQALARSPFHPCSAIDKHLQQHKNNQVTNSSTVKYTGNGSGVDSPPMTPVKSNLDARLFPKLSKMIREIIKGDSIYGDSSTTTTTTTTAATTTTPDNLGSIDNDGTTNFNNNNTLNKNNNSINIDYYSTNNKNNCIKSNTAQNYENVERLARDCGADSIDDVNAATAMLALKHGPKVFTETFNNGSPVITNSPSEDHTYSAGGGSSVSGSTVGVGNIIIVGSSGICSSNSSVTGQIGSHNGSDNVSNGVSSDAAYESSEESHNITAEELEEQRRVEGVDALLSLSSMFDISATPSPSPIKRPSSLIIEEEHISSYMENIPHLNGKGILAANSTIDEGYNTPASYYSHLMSNSTISSGSLSGSLPKKLKQSRGIRAKIKRKTAWIR